MLTTLSLLAVLAAAPDDRLAEAQPASPSVTLAALLAHGIETMRTVEIARCDARLATQAARYRISYEASPGGIPWSVAVPTAIALVAIGAVAGIMMVQ